jgi:TetR/AcrR family transcriptional repressor of lmrAB and yxaGH operons
MVLATLDLLRQSGLSGAGINQVVAASAAPKGSVYHYFPGGKLELTSAALKEAEHRVGQWFREVFHQPAPIATKVVSLFAAAGKSLEGNQFTRGCPVAAVTLDIDPDSEELRGVCHTVFDNWQEIIAAGLDGVPQAERRGVAQLILATLEGALILSRAEATKEPLLRAGDSLAGVLALKFPARSSLKRPKGGRRRG